MRQYCKPDVNISIFDSEDIIMVSGTAADNIMTQLTETFNVDKSAVDSARYENWGDRRFE